MSAESAPFPDTSTSGVGRERQNSVVATVGDGISLLVWSDDRRDPLAFDFDLIGARYAADGALLDTRAFPIVTGAATWESGAALAFGGGVFLVVWSEGTPENHTIARGVRVTPDGTVLDQDPLELGAGFSPQAAFAGDRFHVTTGGRELFVTPVSPEGVVGSPVFVADSGGGNVSLTSGGVGMLLSYDDTLGHHFTVLDANAGFVSELVVPESHLPLVAGGATGFVLVEDAEGQVTRFRRLDASGNALDELEVPGIASVASVTRRGDGYVMANYESTYRYDDADSVLGPAVPIQSLETSPERSRITLASDATATTLAWHSTAHDTYSVRLDETGAPLDAAPRLAPHGSASELGPALASMGGKGFIAFSQTSRDSSVVRHARIDPDGTLPNGVHEIANAESPAVASSPLGTMLVWVDVMDATLGVAPVMPDGSLGERKTIPVVDPLDDTPRVNPPSIVASPDGFVVAHGASTSAGPYVVRVVTLDSTGSVLGSQIHHGFTYGAAAVVNGEIVLALNDSMQTMTLRCSNGTDLTSLWSDEGELPTIASDGQRALVALVQEGTVNLESVQPDCSRGLGLFPKNEVPARGAHVSFDGDQYLLTWREKRANDTNLVGTRITRENIILDPQGFTISSEPEKESSAQTALLEGFGMVAYTRFVPELDAVRIFTRSLAFPEE